MEKEKQKGKVGTVISGAAVLVFANAPGWVGLFFDHGEEISGAMSSVMPFVQTVWPFAAMIACALLGWNVRKWYVSKHPEVDGDEKDTKIKELKEAIDERDAQIDGLEGQCSYLLQQNENLEEAREADSKAYDVMVNERATKKHAEEQRAEKLEQSRVELVKHLSFEAKEALGVIHDNGFIDMPNGKPFDNLGFGEWIDYETRDCGTTRWFLKDWAREFLDTHPELLDCAKQAQERREAVYDSIADHGYQKTIRTAGELYGFEE